ncbi:hypothetical protein T09_2395 [Trichinella sp. T9]|nr:hypothetical protein T09_2395 [Trichinella sp. T9]
MLSRLAFCANKDAHLRRGQSSKQAAAAVAFGCAALHIPRQRIENCPNFDQNVVWHICIILRHFWRYIKIACLKLHFIGEILIENQLLLR